MDREALEELKTGQQAADFLNAVMGSFGAVAAEGGLWQIEDAVKLLLAERERYQWQPIETAPKDGRAILIFWRAWSSRPFVAQWSGRVWVSERILHNDDPSAPMCWMPLPTPPALQSGGSNGK